MCGICGWIDFGPELKVERSILERMNATLTHRGPDDAGVAVFDGSALGMSRLSIIDLTSGRQPIANEDGSCWIVYNGEVYNFLDLRRELETRGYRFRTRSDTEVILRAYEEWGPDCVHRLRGMFAFAIYDCRTGNPCEPASAVRGRIFLARDRLGKKPLYYYYDGKCLVFASEIKAILTHPMVPRRVNQKAIPLYLTYGYVPAPSTMFEDIYELSPGHSLTVQDGQVRVREYWDIPLRTGSNLALSEQKCIERLRELLEDAVRIRLISDVPLGAFLSGGLDSTAIVAYMSRLMGQPVKTFAIGFADDPSFNELEYARLAKRTYGTDHHEFIVRPDAIKLLPKLVWHYDQPFADSSAIPTYLVSQLAREHVTVALTGDGGDELFAGYERFVAARLAQAYRRLPQSLQGVLAYVLCALPESTKYDGFVRRARRFVENAPLPLAQGYLGLIGIFHDGFIQDLLADRSHIDFLHHFATYFEQVHDSDPIGQLLAVHNKTSLPGDLLVKTDRMTMANSLEARCPFLDQELVEFAAGLPTNLKLKGLTTKYILKQALRGVVPKEIIHRKKHGFSMPIGHWFRTNLKEYLQGVLLSPYALGRGYFKEDAVRRLVAEHQTGRRDHSHRLWALLTFELWQRLFIDDRYVADKAANVQVSI